MLEVKTNTIQLGMDDNNLKFSFGKGDTEWNWTSEYRPKMECKEGTVYFDEALEIHHELVQNGIGKGIRSSFAGFEIEGKKVPYAFETYAWIEECTEDIFFEESVLFYNPAKSHFEIEDYLTVVPYEPKKGLSREFLTYFVDFLKQTAEEGLDALMDFLADPAVEDFEIVWNNEAFEKGRAGLTETEFYPYPRY